jgi:protein Mpv17
MEIVRTLFRSYASALHNYPVQMKVGTSVTLSFLGDIFAQNLEHMYKSHKKNQGKSNDGDQSPNPKRTPWKWNKRRTISVALFGAIWGGTAHYWYAKLDSLATFYFPYSIYKQTGFKVALDMLIFEPFSVGLFFIGVGAMEGRKYEQIRGKIVDSFLPTIAVDLVVWPTITAYVFLKIPVNWQVIAFASMDFFYDSFLSIVQHNDVFRELGGYAKNVPGKLCPSHTDDASKCAEALPIPSKSLTPPTSPTSPLSPSSPKDDPNSIVLEVREKSET